MLLDKKTKLTFVKIATEWAREVAPEPGSLRHNEIFHELVKALWRGDFEDEEGENTDLTMALPPARQPGGKWVDEHHQRTEKPRKIKPIIRRELLYELWSDCPPGVTLPSRQRLSPFPNPETGEPPVPWSELKTKIPWGALDALRPNEYSPTFREAYFEALTISKDDFGGWCDEQGHQRPQFWFGEQADARRKIVNSKGGHVGRWPASQSQVKKIWEEFDKLVQGFTFNRGELAHIAGEIGEETGYKQNTVEKLIRSKYRGLEERQRQNST